MRWLKLAFGRVLVRAQAVGGWMHLGAAWHAYNGTGTQTAPGSWSIFETPSSAGWPGKVSQKPRIICSTRVVNCELRA